MHKWGFYFYLFIFACLYSVLELGWFHIFKELGGRYKYSRNSSVAHKAWNIYHLFFYRRVHWFIRTYRRHSINAFHSQFIIWSSLNGILINFYILQFFYRLIIDLAIKNSNFSKGRRFCVSDPWASTTSSNCTLTPLPHWISFCSVNTAHVFQPRAL